MRVRSGFFFFFRSLNFLSSPAHVFCSLGESRKPNGKQQLTQGHPKAKEAKPTHAKRYWLAFPRERVPKVRFGWQSLNPCPRRRNACWWKCLSSRTDAAIFEALFLFYFIDMYLTASGLSWSTRDLLSQCTGLSSCGTKGTEPAAPALKGSFLTTGPPGKSLEYPFVSAVSWLEICEGHSPHHGNCVNHQ